MRIIFTVITFLLIVHTGHTQNLKKVKLADGLIKMKIPSEFIEMTLDDMVLRFPSVRSPLGAYTSEDRLSDFNVKISATQWRRSDVEIAQRFFKASIYNLFDRVTLIEEGISEVNNSKLIFFEFESYLRGDNDMGPDRKYNYLVYYLGLGRTLVFSFRCPERQKEQYAKRMEGIISSIKIKD